MYLTHDYPRFSLLIHPPQDLEDDIAKLEANSELSSADKLRLASLKAELEKINKKKEDRVQNFEDIDPKLLDVFCTIHEFAKWFSSRFLLCEI